MIVRLPYARIPYDSVIARLPDLLWLEENGSPPSSKTAALMVYIALNFMADVRWTDPLGPPESTSEATYDELAQATGLSRTLIHAGLERLKAWGMIAATGPAQSRGYEINYPSRKHIRLPVRAIVNAAGVIEPFGAFKLRNKTELHALKVYLYLASIRSNTNGWSMVSYEKINERTGVAEKDVRKATSQLIAIGLLQGVDRAYSERTGQNEPNKYFLAGYRDLFNRDEVMSHRAAATTTTADDFD